MSIKNKNNIYSLTETAMFAALICCLTVFLKIPIPASEGYIHPGDTLIFIAAAFLPLPYAIFASAIGAGFADLFSGYALWIIPTVIIKSLIVMPVNFLYRKESAQFYKYLSLLISGVISVSGYLLFGRLLTGNYAALSEVIPNIIQAVTSSVLYLVLIYILNKTNFTEKIRRIR